MIPVWRGVVPHVRYEFRKDVKRSGAPIFSDTDPRDGFCFSSLYGYFDDTVEKCVASGHTKNLKGTAVFSNLLILDCDTKETAEKAEEILRELGVRFQRWTTGNRGCHFHIPIHAMSGTNVVYSQRMWLKKVGLWEVVDNSIYKESGQIRIPNAVHSKTNRLKRPLAAQVEGVLLEIPVLARPPIVVKAQERENPDEALQDYHKNLLVRRGEGSRNQHMFILWTRGLEAGLGELEIKDDLAWWNEHFADPPHTDREVARMLRGWNE